jgi:hypothetical protein
MSTTTAKRGPGRPTHIGGCPPGRVTVTQSAAESAQLAYDVQTGASASTVLEFTVHAGEPAVYVHSPATRGGSGDAISSETEVAFDSPMGLAWVAQQIAEHKPNHVRFSSGALRAILKASYGDRDAVDRFAEKLAASAKQYGCSIVIEDATIATPAVEPTPEPTFDPTILKGKIVRGQVTHLSVDEARSTVGLIDALTKVGGEWLGKPVAQSVVLTIGCESYFSPRLNGELIEAGGRRISRRYDSTNSVTTLRDHLATLVDEFAVSVFLFDREAAEIGERIPGLAFDAAELARELRVAVVIA